MLSQVRLLPARGAVTRVGLGTWATFGDGVDTATARGVVFAALDAGINHFDTAPNYADGMAEEWLGQYLSAADRAGIVLATKAFFHPKRDGVPGLQGLGRKSLFLSVENSLRRLRCASIDLLYCHRPDPDTPLEETLGALADLRRQGKIDGWGVSRWSAELTLRAVALAGELGLPPPSAAQEPCNRLYTCHARDLAKALRPAGVPLVGYSLLARGVLTGKYLDGIPPDSRAARSQDCPEPWETDAAERASIRQLLRLAVSRGISPASLLIADALRSSPCAVVLTGASSPEQVAEIAVGLKVASEDDIDLELEDIFHDASH